LHQEPAPALALALCRHNQSAEIMATRSLSPKSSECTQNSALTEKELSRLLWVSGVARHLRTTLLHALQVAEVLTGNDHRQIRTEFFVSFDETAGQMSVYRRTVQRNFHRLIQEGLLEVVKFTDAKSREPDQLYNVWVNDKHFRRPRTFRLNLEKLRSKPRCREYRHWGMRDIHEQRAFESGRRPPQHERRISSPMRPASPASCLSGQPAPSPAPSPSPSGPQEARPARVEFSRSGHRIRELRSHEASKLVARMRELMEGTYGKVGIDGLWVAYEAGDSRIRPALPRDQALISACLTLGINPEQAREYLKLFPEKLLEELSPETPLEEV
jgi:hypothetical protein